VFIATAKVIQKYWYRHRLLAMKNISIGPKKTLLVELLTLTLWYESGDPYINRKNISAIA